MGTITSSSVLSFLLRSSLRASVILMCLRDVGVSLSTTVFVTLTVNAPLSISKLATASRYEDKVLREAVRIARSIACLMMIGSRSFSLLICRIKALRAAGSMALSLLILRRAAPELFRQPFEIARLTGATEPNLSYRSNKKAGPWPT